jgi:hypothetical protein
MWGIHKTLRMGAVYCSKMSVNFHQTIRHHSSENSRLTLHSHRSKTLKSNTNTHCEKMFKPGHRTFILFSYFRALYLLFRIGSVEWNNDYEWWYIMMEMRDNSRRLRPRWPVLCWYRISDCNGSLVLVVATKQRILFFLSKLKITGTFKQK